MMENEMQLNISAPLLSMRKHLSPRVPAVGTVAIVTGKPPLGGHLSLLEERSEWESVQGQPIAVPFIWEKAPGRPKGNCLYHFDKEPAITPWTSFGTPFDVCTLRPPPGRLVDVNRVAGGVRSPRLTSGTLVDETHISGEKSMVQNSQRCRVEAFTTTDHASSLERLEECLDADRESDNDSGDDAFFDALDTLSPNKLLSLKSSISGLSSSYHQNSGSSGHFTADLQTRDFMLSRFLPAAKAAVVHTPRHVPKKQRGIDVRPYANQHLEYIEIEDEEVEYDDPEIRTEMTCGFFRRLCAKNVTSHPWMKLKTQSSKPSSGKVKRLIKNVYPSEVTSEELPKVFNKLRDEPKRISFSTNSHKMADKLSPTICPKNRKASSIGNERPSSMFHEGARFLCLPKPIEPKTDEIIPLIERDEAIIEVSAQRSNKQRFDPLVVTAEKKMYADTLQKKVTNTKFDSSKAERPSKSLTKNFVAGSESVCDFGSTGMASASIRNSKIPGVSLIKQKCDHEGNFLGLEEHKGSENFVNGRKECNWTVLLPPMPPPSPKTPSDSWLWRTLPPIYSRNYFSHPNRGSHLQHVSKDKQPINGTKFGKVVKSSKIHDDHHVRFSKAKQ